MSPPQVFNLNGKWTPEAVQTPPGAFMQAYLERIVDARNFDVPYEEWHTSDFTVVKPNGEILSGGAKVAFEQSIKDLYGPFTANYHEPHTAVVWENDEGWEMIGLAEMFANMPVPGDDPKVKDLNGKEWDVKIPMVGHFHFVKDPNGKVGGLLSKKNVLYGDSYPIVQMMMKRGMIQA